MDFLTTIQGMMVVGALIAAVVGLIFNGRKAGCFVFALIPIAAAILAQIRLSNLPDEMLRSTSALEIPFAAIWTGFGALMGFLISSKINERRNR